MKDNWLTLEVYLAPPGANRNLVQSGVRAIAAIDTGAAVTFLPKALVRTVLGTDAPGPTSKVLIESVSGAGKFMTVPLLVGLSTADHELLHAQVDCVVNPIVNQVRLGNDVLSLLGLELRVDYQRQQVRLERYTWERFEDEVASIYRSLGASVKQNLNLGGFQVDLVVAEGTQSGQKLRLLVECKFYLDKVGNRIVNDFARVVATLKTANHIDRGVIVSHRGFTQDASLVAQNTGIELLTLDDLRQRLPQAEKVPSPVPRKRRKKAEPSRHPSVPSFFVVMAFAPEMDDIYHLGIRETVLAVGGACERADEIQHTGGILEKTYDSIRRADIVIAEVSLPNPNVFYEVGFAHALGKPVVLLTREIAGTPFDLRGYNHIVYKSILELRNKLKSMLQQVLK